MAYAACLLYWGLYCSIGYRAYTLAMRGLISAVPAHIYSTLQPPGFLSLRVSPQANPDVALVRQDVSQVVVPSFALPLHDPSDKKLMRSAGPGLFTTVALEPYSESLSLNCQFQAISTRSPAS
jgi:hypothetical protein